MCQIKKDLVSTHSLKPGLSITQGLNKILKIPGYTFLDIGNEEKILNCVVVGARQSFQFFRQITSLLGNNRGFFKFK